MPDELKPPRVEPIPLSYSIPPKPRRWLFSRWLVWSILASALLTIIAAVSLPMRGRCDADYPTSAAHADIAALCTALDTYEVDTGRYPTNAQGLAALSSAPAGVQKWQGPYTAKPIINDPWGHPYIYRCPGTHNPRGFDLLSVGRDGQEGTGDDVHNW